MFILQNIVLFKSQQIASCKFGPQDQPLPSQFPSNCIDGTSTLGPTGGHRSQGIVELGVRGLERLPRRGRRDHRWMAQAVATPEGAVQ